LQCKVISSIINNFWLVNNLSMATNVDSQQT
jgi:hypothetical protein